MVVRWPTSERSEGPQGWWTDVHFRDVQQHQHSVGAWSQKKTEACRSILF